MRWSSLYNVIYKEVNRAHKKKKRVVRLERTKYLQYGARSRPSIGKSTNASIFALCVALEFLKEDKKINRL